MSTAAAGAQRSRRGRWIPWTFAGGFLVVVAANAALVAFSLTTFTGLTTTEPYTKGLRYNDALRLSEAQRRLGWRIATRIDQSERGRVTIELSATEGDGRPLRGAEALAEFVRPIEPGHDFVATFDDLGNGRHRLTLALPLPGQWEVRYRLRRDDELVEVRERLQAGASP